MAPKPSILLVEDEADVRRIAELALVRVGGFAVRTAESGEAALRAFAEARPGVVLLDVMMPGMDGPAVLRAIRALPEGRDVPIVFMTARTQRAEVDRYLALGAVGVITKPFDPMTLSDDLSRVLGLS